MHFSNPFSDLNRFELGLWLGSAAMVTVSFIISGAGDWLTMIASLIGVTSLILVAKGRVTGQLLMVVFSLFYGVISYWQRYYGEMITYLGMTAPMAVVSMVSWLRHPYKDSAEVEVSRLSRRQLFLLPALTAAVTVLFYFILRALGSASLAVSTVSITTSFAAALLTFWRSPWYALAYAANDVVLIVLWVIAALGDSSCGPMVICFAMFLLNDIYGFVSWRRMSARQAYDAHCSLN